MTQIDVDKVTGYGVELPDQSIQLQKFTAYVVELEVPIETFERQAVVNASSSVLANRNLFRSRGSSVFSSSSLSADFSYLFSRSANLSGSSFVASLRRKRFNRAGVVLSTSNVLEQKINFVKKRQVNLGVQSNLVFDLQPEDIKRKPNKSQIPRRQLIDKRTIPVVVPRFQKTQRPD